jgi:hypothetical protein
VSIPLDTYFVVTPPSQFSSKSYATLNGTDLFVYVNETNELRVVNMNSSATNATPGTITYTLAQDVKWVRAVSLTGVVHIYYADTSGNLWLIEYRQLGATITSINLTGFATAVTFSAIYTPQTSPPAFIMLVDDGIRHNVYVATDSQFLDQLVSPTVVYNNTLSPTIYLSFPSIAMHPQDTTRATVTVEQTIIQTSVTSVGFYEIVVPGLS